MVRPLSMDADVDTVPWPEELVRDYQARGFWGTHTISSAFVDAVRRFGDRIAIVDRDRRVTYTELGTAVDRLASRLAEHSICRGERVVFQLPNCLEFVIAYFACLRVGAVPICCLPHHRFAEISALAELGGARALLIPDTFRGYDYLALAEAVREKVRSIEHVWVVGKSRAGSRATTACFEELLLAIDDVKSIDGLAGPSPADVAVLQLSGGTTGLPKLIPRTHADYLYNSTEFARATSVDEGTTMLLPIPLAHNFPLACPGLQGALLAGAKVVLALSPSPEIVFPLIERERVTWVPAVPATVIRWTEYVATATAVDTSSLRHVYVGGQRLNPEPARAAIAVFGPVIRQVYGMAEGLLCCTSDSDPPEAHVQYQGRPMSTGDVIRVVDDDEREVATGEIGELQCRGPYTIRGYYRAALHNKVAFTADGFYRTGDLVRVSAEGFISVEGRKKDVINRGGEKISAEEIEDLIHAHPAVRTVAVVATPDPVYGERACACIVLHPDATLDLGGLAAFLNTRQIAAYKIPERLEIFDALPLTGVGKVAKTELRALIVARRAAATQQPP